MKDQELEATNFHNLKMLKAESIASYTARAEGLVEAMAHSGIAKTHLPSPAAQAMKFINGLDIEIESYLQLTAHCENSLSAFETDVYPKSLPDALRFASKFKAMTPPRSVPPSETIAPPVQTSTALFAAKTETAGEKKKNGKADSGIVHSAPTPAADDGDDHNWKKKLTCRTCGVKGHVEKECPEKAAFQEFLALRKAKSATVMYTSFNDDEMDNFVPHDYCNGPAKDGQA